MVEERFSQKSDTTNFFGGKRGGGLKEESREVKFLLNSWYNNWWAVRELSLRPSVCEATPGNFKKNYRMIRKNILAHNIKVLFYTEG